MQSHQSELGYRIRTARRAKHLGTPEVAAAAGISRSTLIRIENGRSNMPSVRIVERLARVLSVPQAELLGLMGWIPPTELPTFTPYLRSKFSEMPAAARRELEQSFREIAEKYGYDPDGPAPGEDET